MKGIVFNIVRGSLHDGRGVRTVVYLKGCHLRCQWCHNPEGLSFAPQRLYYQHLCIGCGTCIKTCPQKSFSLEAGKLVIDEQSCKGCMKCVETCPVNAIVRYGEEYTATRLYDVINKDKGYYDVSMGGVTVSGGECLDQVDFLSAFFSLCKKGGIHTCIETSLDAPWEKVLRVVGLCDAMIVDVKAFNAKKHKQGTGVSNVRIKENLEKLSRLHTDILLRTPIIPYFNDDEKELESIVNFINSLGNGVKYYELLRYNNLSESKYMALKKSVYGNGAQPQTQARMEELKAFVKKRLKKNIILI